VAERLPLPASRRLRSAQKRLDSTIERLIEERGDDVSGRTDLLSLLLQARDERGEAMPRRQVRDEAMTVVLAGHETTAQGLTWTWYLLSRNPDAEARVHEEIRAVLGDRPATAADLAALTLTRAAVAESMRLYPPAWAMGRRALRDVELGGYTVPKGAIVGMSQLVVHRDPRWWPEPEQFDLDRWTDAGEATRPRFAYFPFGGGGRMCLGERFAWMEATLLVATIAQRWRFRLVPGHPVKLSPRITLRPKHGMRMTVEPR
jgi:cytochrome P450